MTRFYRGSPLPTIDRELQERTDALIHDVRGLVSGAQGRVQQISQHKADAMEAARRAAEAFVNSQYRAELEHAFGLRQRLHHLYNELHLELSKQRWNGSGAEQESWEIRSHENKRGSVRVVRYGVFEVFEGRPSVRRRNPLRHGQIIVRILKKDGKPSKRVCPETSEWRLRKGEAGKPPAHVLAECERAIDRIANEIAAVESAWAFTGPAAKTVEVISL